MQGEMKKFILDFLNKSDRASEELNFQPIPGDGSSRLFWRITILPEGSTLIAMSNPPYDNMAKRENLAYVKIGQHLHLKGAPVPEFCHYDLGRGLFIMEDMGHTSLQQVVASSRDHFPLYHRVLEHLFRMQVDGAVGFDTTWCCQTKIYDQMVMRRYEADYFKDAFLKGFVGLKTNGSELEPSFNHLSETASRTEAGFFLHRDFQSRNIMVSGENIGILDWQGGRLGPLGYDLASLLVDPYSDLPAHHKEKIYHGYLTLIGEQNPGWVAPFEESFPYLSILRNLQILGAFSYLSKVKEKNYFEAYMPAALRTLQDSLRRLSDPKLSTLRHLVENIDLFHK